MSSLVLIGSLLLYSFCGVSAETIDVMKQNEAEEIIEEKVLDTHASDKKEDRYQTLLRLLEQKENSDEKSIGAKQIFQERKAHARELIALLSTRNERVKKDLFSLFESEEVNVALQEKILALKEELEECYAERSELLAIKGYDEKHEAVIALDMRIRGLEKKIEDTLYDDGVVNGNTALALAVGLLVTRAYWNGDNNSKKEAFLKNIKPLLAGMGSAIGAEYFIRGRRAFFVKCTFSVVREALKMLAKTGLFLFEEGGAVDTIEQAIEDNAHGISQWFGEHLTDVAFCAVPTGLLFWWWKSRKSENEPTQ